LSKQKKVGVNLEFLAVIFILLIVVIFLGILAVSQIKMAGMKVVDFWSFVQANDVLDKLYIFCLKYEKLTPTQQVIFLKEAEKVFDAFDKVPNALWEEEYQKYMEILNKYKEIKITRWESN